MNRALRVQCVLLYSITALGATPPEPAAVPVPEVDSQRIHMAAFENEYVLHGTTAYNI